MSWTSPSDANLLYHQPNLLGCSWESSPLIQLCHQTASGKATELISRKGKGTTQILELSSSGEPCIFKLHLLSSFRSRAAHF